MDIQDHPSCLGDPASMRFEAYSCLPPKEDAEIGKQLQRVAETGWDVMVEHDEPENAGDGRRYMRKLPPFGERDVETILAEAKACRDANPGHNMRLSATDRKAQSMAFSLVVFRV